MSGNAARPLVFLAALAFAVGLGVLRVAGQDTDGDGTRDALTLGGARLQVFWTKGDVLPRSETGAAVHRPGGGWESAVGQAVRDNDFVGDVLHRDDQAEVETVRRAGAEIMNGATAPREKVERLLAWLGGHWDFSVERSTVNAARLLERRQGMCETSGLVVGVLEAMGVKAREVNVALPGFAPDIAIEAWLDGRWHLVHVFDPPRRIDERSVLDMLPGHERHACIVYYWRDAAGKPRRTKVWYDERSAPLFTTAQGLREPPSALRLTY